MNKLTTQLVGATIGAAVGYLIADWYIDANMSFEEDFELEDPIEDFELEDPIEDFELEDPIEKFNSRLERKAKVTETSNGTVVKRAKNYTEYFRSEGREDLAALAAKYSGDSNEDLIDQPYEIEATWTKEWTNEEVEGLADLIKDDMYAFVEEQAKKDPSIISVSEYANDQEFAHLTLSLYDDDVVTDEEDNPINRPEKILGDDVLLSFEELSEDGDTVYVRNRAKKAMYEVVRTNKNYAAPVAPKRVRRNSKEEVVNDDEEQNT